MVLMIRRFTEISLSSEAPKIIFDCAHRIIFIFIKIRLAVNKTIIVVSLYAITIRFVSNSQEYCDV